jgi:hypothetical protein
LKSLKKIILKLLTVGLIVILTLYIGMFLYYRFAWKNHYSKQQVDSLIADINSTPVLPDSFYVLYDRVYKDRHESITSKYLKQFWTEFLMLQYPLQNNWQYVAANMQPYKGSRYKVAPMSLAFRINNDATPEKCFDYIMRSRYSEYCNKFKITDTIASLTEREQIISFIVANQRPWYYKIHPTRFKIEVDSIKKVLELNELQY